VHAGVQLKSDPGQSNNGQLGRVMAATSGENGRLNILVVDDEQLVANSLVQVLNMVGFNAFPLYGGSDAVEQATQKPYDVLICDVVMAGMTGIDAAIEIRKVLPHCRVLLVSGNTRTTDMLKYAHEQGHDFDILAKPVHPSEIIDRLKMMSIVN
jgi:CheY-like chemotaxis protein